MIYFGSVILGFIFILLAYRLLRYKLTKYNRENIGLSMIACVELVVFRGEFVKYQVAYILLISAALLSAIVFLYGFLFKSNGVNEGPGHR
ncbi:MULTISPECIES: hypothetical protein [unclassified Paenibacillus]|uniref:hypothetical protein n=1 Tax=unclassified Paenibacillus TaxID=185978 RepID=UPI00104ED609|nr:MULTISPECIES: hypothetical protein [unclassified Paenibacillus]NIK69498.1 hypothetical protein [Paenibacillus sp. BK720]TCM95676.1 hypothetical protein EV294_10643 [Paenibacillus sp. BK033]